MRVDVEEASEILNGCVDVLETVADSIGFLPNDEKEEVLKSIKSHGKEFCKVDMEFQKSLRALSNTEEHVGKADIGSNVEVNQIYAKFLRDDKKDNNYTSHPLWERINKLEANALEVVHDESSMQGAEYEMLSDSLLCSQTLTKRVDPLTKKPIVNMYKNKSCGHIYELESILHHIKNGKLSGAVCPYIGCQNKHVTQGQLEEMPKTSKT